ncbi:hypothetical protein [Campylobacter sp. RM16192]|uniref:hypothetical protein n=1 Tax=Campylobacter sp. RM16192 TaxID=1660080 RepID=UPI00159AA1CC|nr:hypothetical protein [Campylobacter sp. RM16192]QKU36247.1 hypothetical protein CDOMC_a035 [Campylobacter sp. RM16192]
MKEVEIKQPEGKEKYNPEKKYYKIEDSDYIVLPSAKERPDLYPFNGFFHINNIEIEEKKEEDTLENQATKAIESKENQVFIVDIETDKKELSHDIHGDLLHTDRNLDDFVLHEYLKGQELNAEDCHYEQSNEDQECYDEVGDEDDTSHFDLKEYENLLLDSVDLEDSVSNVVVNDKISNEDLITYLSVENEDY